MVLRMLAAFILVVLVRHELPAQQVDTAAKVGDHLVISMMGDLAKEYAKRTGTYSEGKFPNGLQIDTIATIERELDEKQFRFEHTTYVVANGKPNRLVTLTGIVDSKRFSRVLPPKDAQVYANPGEAPKPTPGGPASKLLSVDLHDLKGLKICTWTLTEEIGDEQIGPPKHDLHHFPD